MSELQTPPILHQISNLTIGDIAISDGKILTPNGISPISGSQWIFSDISRTENKIPPVAIVLAIVFMFLCLIGVLFLLIKEEKTTGYVEVSVHGENLFHKVQIPVKNQREIKNIQSLVGKAQSLAMISR